MHVFKYIYLDNCEGIQKRKLKQKYIFHVNVDEIYVLL